MKKKKVSLRRCLGCQESKDKRSLIRVVKNKENEFDVDFSGKKPGRGAYICNSKECFLKAKKSRQFERAFSSKIPEDIYRKLEGEIENE